MTDCVCLDKLYMPDCVEGIITNTVYKTFLMFFLNWMLVKHVVQTS